MRSAGKSADCAQLLSRLLSRAKKLQGKAIQQEVRREVARLFQIVMRDWEKSGRFDLEAVEMRLRDGMHRVGARRLTYLLQWGEPTHRLVDCGCSAKAGYVELRPKQILAAVGPVSLLRPYYLYPTCHQGQSPADQELAVAGTRFSPGVRRMMTLVGSQAAFEK